jgi:hypothetical protein
MSNWTLGQLGKQSQFKANQSQFKANQSQLKPIQTQIQKGQNERNILHNKGI